MDLQYELQQNAVLKAELFKGYADTQGWPTDWTADWPTNQL